MHNAINQVIAAKKKTNKIRKVELIKNYIYMRSDLRVK